ncbi:MAG TPA: glycosyltransferase [Thermoplasmata archaeon]|nr:glycosyltransferase [Thermoplasmata archaeon]
MDVAFFTESYPPTRDGVATVVSALARTLTRLGHRVQVFTPNPVKGESGGRVDLDGVEVVRSRSVPVPLYSEYRWAVFPFTQLIGERFGSRVDVVHVHTPGIMGSEGFLAARRWHKPLVGTFHTNVYEMQESFEGRPFVQLFLRIASFYGLGTYWRCDTTTAPTQAARRALEARATKPFRRPVQVIPNGIELDRFHPGISTPDWRERCGLPDAPLVTFLGRLTADKGIHRFLDAIESIPRSTSFSALIAGSGPESTAVRARLASESPTLRRARYIGPVAEEEKPSLLAQSDVFVLPSTADTSSVALLEAMASGAACIASTEGGPAEIVRDGVTGRLVPVREPGPLAARIAELVEDAAGRRRLGQAGVEYVRRTASIEVVARRFISLYEVLLSERAGGAVGPGR